MNLAIVTRADDNISEMTNMTHRVIKSYVEQWNCDFHILSHDCEIPHAYRIMKLYDMLDEYDRILNLDSDLLITPNCPNIFDVVPETHIGTIFEDKGTRRSDRINRINLVQEKWGDIGWKKGYFNTGVFIVSKCHKELFSDREIWRGRGFDDVMLGYYANKLKLPIHELDYRFNHMSMFSEPWNNNADRFNSYIIHYAGQGGFPDKGNRSRLRLIYDDLMRIYK